MGNPTPAEMEEDIRYSDAEMTIERLEHEGRLPPPRYHFDRVSLWDRGALKNLLFSILLFSFGFYLKGDILSYLYFTLFGTVIIYWVIDISRRYQKATRYNVSIPHVLENNKKARSDWQKKHKRKLSYVHEIFAGPAGTFSTLDYQDMGKVEQDIKWALKQKAAR